MTTITGQFDDKAGVNALVQAFYENTGIQTLTQSYGIGLDGSIVAFDGHDAEPSKPEVEQIAQLSNPVIAPM